MGHRDRRPSQAVTSTPLALRWSWNMKMKSFMASDLFYLTSEWNCLSQGHLSCRQLRDRPAHLFLGGTTCSALRPVSFQPLNLHFRFTRYDKNSHSSVVLTPHWLLYLDDLADLHANVLISIGCNKGSCMDHFSLRVLY